MKHSYKYLKNVHMYSESIQIKDIKVGNHYSHFKISAQKR